MPKSEIEWTWEEAFYKFGFGDGDGPNFTDVVIGVLDDLGYQAEAERWGMHNYMIQRLEKDDEIIFWNGCDFNMGLREGKHDAVIGYDDPRDYLPEDIVKHLDEQLPP